MKRACLFPVLVLPLALGVALLTGCATTGGKDKPAPTAASTPATRPELLRPRAGCGTVLVGGSRRRPTSKRSRPRRDRRRQSPDGRRDEGIGFDEVAAIEQLGIGYLSLPVEGSSAYTPELLEPSRSGRAGQGRSSCTAPAARAPASSTRLRGEVPRQDAGRGYAALKPLGGWPLAMERCSAGRSACSQGRGEVAARGCASTSRGFTAQHGGVLPASRSSTRLGDAHDARDNASC